MAVYKHGNTYWMEFTWHNRRVRQSTGTATKSDALNVEREYRLELARGNLGLEPRRAVPTLAEFAQPFMDRIALERAERPATIAFYAEKLRRLLEYAPLRTARLDRIDEAMVDAFVQWRLTDSGRKYLPATCNRQLATLRRLLRMAYRRKLIARGPQIKLMPGERPREFVLSAAQELRYFEHAPQPLRDIATLALDCGLRLGEALRLQSDCAQLVPLPVAPFGCLHVAHSKRDNAKRYLPLTQRAAGVVAGRIATRPTVFLLESAPGVAYLGTSIDHMHAVTRTAAGLPTEFVLHGLRHTFGSRLADAGVDSWAIQKLMGHASIVTSQRYIHRAPEALGDAIQLMAALGAAPGTPAAPWALPPGSAPATEAPIATV